MENTSEKGRKSVRSENVLAEAVKKRARNSSGGDESSEMYYIDRMPSFMHPYIEAITNVKGDGNCGYHVIALDSRNNEHDFQLIKDDMLNELRLHEDDYLNLYGDDKRLAYITEALLPSKRNTRRGGVALMEKWFTFPDMGHVAASILNRVVLQDGCPIPQTCPAWRNHCSPEAAAWESYFLDRQTRFEELEKAEIRDNKTKIGVGSNFDDPLVL
ncbi:sex determination protein tasselseed-2 [Trifolium pratense]|uniref:Sex determination protein tasselseed-2 n=1 Tax=Trifolium pratense TaxID=57577 RepID=A0A2K3PAB4_TRIPR|nr:sex determination protein tasselseed-2 [Trifolium pratense]